MNTTPRKCKGHIPRYLRNSKWRKGWTKEEREKNLMEPEIDSSGKCLICGGQSRIVAIPPDCKSGVLTGSVGANPTSGT